MRWYRVNVPGLGNVFVQAGSSQEAVTRARGVAQNQGVNLDTGSTDTQSLTATPTSGPQGGSGFVFSEEGGIQSMSDYLSGGGTQGPTTGPGDPNEGSNSPSDAADGTTTGPDVGAGDDDDKPTATTGFWRINVPGHGNVFYSGTQADALSAAQQFIQSRGLQVGDTDISNMAPVQTNQDNYNGGLRVGLDGAVTGGDFDSWLGQSSGSTGQGGGGTGDDGAAGATGEGDGGNGGATTPTAEQSPIGVTDEEASTLGTFRLFLQNQGTDPNSVLGQTAQRRFDPTYDAFALAQLANAGNQALPTGPNGEQITGGNALADAVGGGTPAGFYEFLSERQGLQRAPEIGLEALRAIAGLSPQENTYGAVFSGATPGTQAGNILEGSTLSALRTLLAPSVANLLGGQLLDTARGGFAQESAAGAATGQSPSYSQYLLQQVLGG